MATKRKTQKQYEYANKDKTKHRNRTLHLIRRFQERHDINLSLVDIEEMVEQIKNGTAKYLWTDKDNTKLFIVTCRGKEVVIVKSGRQFLTTFKPEQKHWEAYERNQKRKELLRQESGIKSAPDTTNSEPVPIKLTLWQKFVAYLKEKLSKWRSLT